MSFDLIDMSKITIIGGNRYCSIFIDIRYATAVVHETKDDEMPEIFDRVLSRTPQARPPTSNPTAHLNITRSSCGKCSRSQMCKKNCIPTSISNFRMDALRS